VVQTYGTDAFGIPAADLTQGTSNQPMQFTGQYTDKEDGFSCLRARYYDPSVGRFMTQDPLRKSGPGVSGWNRSDYVGNNPTRFADRTGLCGSDVCLEAAQVGGFESVCRAAFDPLINVEQSIIALGVRAACMRPGVTVNIRVTIERYVRTDTRGFWIWSSQEDIYETALTKTVQCNNLAPGTICYFPDRSEAQINTPSLLPDEYPFGMLTFQAVPGQTYRIRVSPTAYVQTSTLTRTYLLWNTGGGESDPFPTWIINDLSFPEPGPASPALIGLRY